MEIDAEIRDPRELSALLKHSRAPMNVVDTLLDEISEGLMIVDELGKIIYLNLTASQMIGWDSEHASEKITRNLSENPPGSPFSHQLTTSSGRRLPVRIIDISKNMCSPASHLIILHPGDEQSQVYDPRSDFIASINHEFRTPLAALSASVEFLLDEMSHLKKSEIKELLRSIHVSVTGLQTLIDNLLESSSIEAGRFSIRRKNTSLAEVIDEAILVMQPLLFRRQQKIILNFHEPLPQVYCDPNRIKQVLVNLLSNASKYGPINQTISLKTTQESKQWLRVAVIDQGPGIPVTKRPQLFHQFSRIKDKDGPQFGIGLGLSVVKTIVQEHGGSVGVEEAPAGGSLFWFTIPIYGETDESSYCG